MFKITYGILVNTGNEEVVGNIILKKTDCFTLAQRVMEICKLMKKGDTFLIKRHEITIEKKLKIDAIEPTFYLGGKRYEGKRVD